jgi:hypothetical protein
MGTSWGLAEQATRCPHLPKLDAVAADLKAHREDTEAHPGIYHIGEK